MAKVAKKGSNAAGLKEVLQESAATRTVEIDPAGNQRRYVKLDLDFERLVKSEAFFASRGDSCSLLFCMSPRTLNVDRLRTLVACAAHTWQPELSFDQGRGLVTGGSMYALLNAVYSVWFPDGQQEAGDAGGETSSGATVEAASTESTDGVKEEVSA